MYNLGNKFLRFKESGGDGGLNLSSEDMEDAAIIRMVAGREIVGISDMDSLLERYEIYKKRRIKPKEIEVVKIR